MTTLMLRTAARFLLPLMLMFSIFLLLRGHDDPGGGFIGGLVASAAFSLYAISHSVAAAQQVLRYDPRMISASGLLLAAGSGVLPMLDQDEFLTGWWFAFELPTYGTVDVGTPLFFDIGVFLVVIGVTMTMVLTLAEQ